MIADAYSALVDRIAARTPALVGVGGAVAVGKTTMVRTLAQRLAARGRSVRALSTDAFLLPNAALIERGLLMRKGFPETYDSAAMAASLQRLRDGAAVDVPVYSHDVYNIVAGASETIAPADVVLLEGIVALQAPAADYLDVAIYIDADEADVRRWFSQRFARLTADAAQDPASFYHPFTSMPADQLEQLANATWDGINAPNLHAHIAPSASRADVVVRTAADHSIAALHERNGRELFSD
jgi:type I pantothenate kinase